MILAMKCASLFSVLALGLGASARPCDGEIWPDDNGVHINAQRILGRTR